MDFRRWLQQWLGIYDLQQKVVELESRISQIEVHIASTLRDFGEYKGRTTEELTLMKSQLNTMLETMSNVIDAMENQSDIQRATRLRSRLKNNLTRVINTMSARSA